MGETLEENYRGLTFMTKSPSDQVYYFLPEGGCLWVLTPDNVNNEYLPFGNRELVSNSNLDNILAVRGSKSYPDPVVFGNEPDHNWCFYFEKAELARQQADWVTVISLMDEANSHRLEPNIGIEWLPLVEGYGKMGDWQNALMVSKRIHSMHTKNDPMLCSLWISMDQEGLVVSEDLVQQVFTMANCSE